MKPPCKFGAKCYRKNVTHFFNFSHPPTNIHGDPFPVPPGTSVSVGTLGHMPATGTTINASSDPSAATDDPPNASASSSSSTVAVADSSSSSSSS
eukprot:CAMPEP_0175114006 /NCGR_PEP_ID=MMETSP0086_2-20121207/16561_1 /TAXON_ID=136419 /ORGANISM="Unknown Unknown, Strain D1" /LENGTH=94 /DNA_ID=CAMNT_0016393497 /DNA_START=40 /DNA_END=320 /DNA_ORIENTATION=+